jgi:hypothetical protein
MKQVISLSLAATLAACASPDGGGRASPGTIRRAYLKGLGAAAGCAAPAGPRA